MLVRKANRVDLIRLLLQEQSDLGLPCVGSISSQLPDGTHKVVFRNNRSLIWACPVCFGFCDGQLESRQLLSCQPKVTVTLYFVYNCYVKN